MFWGYTENNVFKNPADLVCDLVDIVSKNGCLLLNIGPRADGTITEEDQAVLREIGQWLQSCGEAIYDTTTWTVFGEGLTEVPEGAFTDGSRAAFTPEDIRFTYKAPFLYAAVLKWPEDGRVCIKSLSKGSKFLTARLKRSACWASNKPLPGHRHRKDWKLMLDRQSGRHIRSA